MDKSEKPRAGRAKLGVCTLNMQIYHVLVTVAVVIAQLGSFSNDNGNGNENVVVVIASRLFQVF